MSSVFTKIVNGEIPSYKIYEDDRYYSFLDIHPLTKGHTLVIPKEETDYLFDLDDDLLGGMMVVAKKIARAIEKVIECKRVGVLVLGTEVPHAHIHLIPFQKETELCISNPKLKLTTDEFAEIAAQIRAQIK